MRILVEFQSEKAFVDLPVNYNYLVQSAIYRNLSPELATFLHEEGFLLEKRRFNLFVFSRLMGKREYLKERKKIRFLEPFRPYLASPTLSKDLLKQYQEIPEPEYSQLMERYFKELLEMGISDESKELWEAIKSLNFEELGKFKLIENIGYVADVYVELKGDPYSTRLADAYSEWRKGEGGMENFKEILGINDEDLKTPYFQQTISRLLMTKMGEYMIQVRLEKFMKNRPPHFSDRDGVDADLFWIPSDQNDDYYDAETGFRDESGNAYIC